MSPTEDDLRRALAERPDEDDAVVNPNRIIAAAREQRSRRRTRLLSAAAAVVVVGGVATGIGFVAHDNSQQAGSSSSVGGDTEPQGNAGGAGGVAGNATSAAGSSQSRATACPSRVPPVTLQPGGGSNSTDGPLFSDPVATVTVCTFPAETGADAARTELTGAEAETFARSLENASRTRPSGICSDLREADQLTLVIIASTSRGMRLPSVVTTINEPACAVIVSNGTALRFGWTWPRSLNSQLVRLLRRSGSGLGGGSGGGPTTALTAPPSPSMHGSPLH